MEKVVEFNKLKEDHIVKHNMEILEDDEKMEHLCREAEDVAEYIKQIHNSLDYKVKIF